ncbi:MAG: hypothetical protein K8S56_04535 [Candidatus Cloacimonetes bacterium]|nr:hypothetical protein [Candidatus Cloacimonadota bacterium]
MQHRNRPLVFCFLLLTAYIFCGAQPLEITDDSITIHFDTGHERFVRHILPLFKNDRLDFLNRLGVYPEIPVQINIAPNRNTYREWTAQPGGIIEYSSGFYHPSSGTIYLSPPDGLKSVENIRRIILHEYIHHFVNYLFPDAPLWFHEGMAQYYSEGVGYFRLFGFAKDYFLGNTQSLRNMRKHYPQHKVQWFPFYVKSALAVHYMASQFPRRYNSLWDRARVGQSFEPAFIRAYMMPIASFEAGFESYLKKRVRIQMLFSASSIIWGFLPFLLLIAWTRKKIKGYYIKKRWESEDSREIIEITDD